jgi:acetyltransferase-like isoleucine patch superfamily enzyme
MKLLVSIYHAYMNKKGLLDLYYEQRFPGAKFFGCRLSNVNLKTYSFGRSCKLYGLRSLGGYLKIGEQVYVNGNFRLEGGDGHEIRIGNDVLIGPDVYISTIDHKINGLPERKGPVTIGNKVWIGQRVTILRNVSIGEGSVVGAGSVVTKNIPAHEIWAGNPAKFLKKVVDYGLVEQPVG